MESCSRSADTNSWVQTISRGRNVRVDAEVGRKGRLARTFKGLQAATGGHILEGTGVETRWECQESLRVR